MNTLLTTIKIFIFLWTKHSASDLLKLTVAPPPPPPRGFALQLNTIYIDLPVFSSVANLGSSAELLIKGRRCHGSVAGGVRMLCALRSSRTSRVVWLGYRCRSVVLCDRRDHCFCSRALLRRDLLIQICWSLELRVLISKRYNKIVKDTWFYINENKIQAINVIAEFKNYGYINNTIVFEIIGKN